MEWLQRSLCLFRFKLQEFVSMRIGIYAKSVFLLTVLLRLVASVLNPALNLRALSHEILKPYKHQTWKPGSFDRCLRRGKLPQKNKRE